MGLFDYLRCEYPLPAPLVQDLPFQTKSFENPFSDDYTLRADGTLWHTEYDYEDRSDPTQKGLLGLAGSMTRINEREVFQEDFSGDLEFHTDYGRRNKNGWGEGWISFQARIMAGRVISVDVIEHIKTLKEIAEREREELDVGMPEALGKKADSRRL